MDPNLRVAILSLIVSVVTSAFVIYVSFLMLRFAAKPRLRIRLVGSEVDIALLPGRTVTLRVHLDNIGYWYAKPRARNTRAYWNFQPGFEPQRLRFGSDLEKFDESVRIGKGGCKYLKAAGIHLSVGEPGEYLEMQVVTPQHSGSYRSWVSAYCDEGDCGVHEFVIKVQ